MAFDLEINGTTYTVDADPQTPLLWVIRDRIGLTGTKFSCGLAQCGACTVHVDGQAIRSCVFPASAAVGKSITTIEGLCYCQSGMIMATTALLESNPEPTDAEIDAAITNICRCGTYHRIRMAIHRAVELMKAEA
jgi:isoquinoline 1-oxidoreductase alpha subunit